MLKGYNLENKAISNPIFKLMWEVFNHLLNQDNYQILVIEYFSL